MKRRARDIMTTEVVAVAPDMRLNDVVKLMLRRRISGLPVVDENGCLLGIITEHDLVNCLMSGNAPRTIVADVMEKRVETYSPDMPVVEIVNDFAARHIRRVPVVVGGKVVGIISRRDIIREMDRIYDQMMGSANA